MPDAAPSFIGSFLSRARIALAALTATVLDRKMQRHYSFVDGAMTIPTPQGFGHLAARLTEVALRSLSDQP